MQINVLVEDAESGDFIVFRQSKYAIPGETLAVHMCEREKERERKRGREREFIVFRQSEYAISGETLAVYVCV